MRHNKRLCEIRGSAITESFLDGGTSNGSYSKNLIPKSTLTLKRSAGIESLMGLPSITDSLLEKMVTTGNKHAALTIFASVANLVGSPLSINALREDLGVAHQSVARWLDIFERLYSIFRVHPFGAPTIRAVKKEAKHYHYDWTQIANEGFRFECLVACHLLKWCH